ncbi:MAG: PDZ domain-containing protein [Chitinophagaceae bacterium]|nr:PDZ domain-containing protein [Chitinophagaceae bacterium]
MKQSIWKVNGLMVVLALMMPAMLLAQKKDKEVKENKVVREVIISSNGDEPDKMVIAIDGDKVTVNGKPIDDFNDGDTKVKYRKLKDVNAMVFDGINGNGAFSIGRDGDRSKRMTYIFGNDDKAMLGVSTSKTDKGVEVKSITKESAAEAAGLKEGDVITKIDDKEINDPDDLSKAIQEHKPGDKVKVTYKRDGKKDKVDVTLTKWKGLTGFNYGFGDSFDYEKLIPKLSELKKLRGNRIFTQPFNQYRMMYDNAPKLGISVQDVDEGNGVKVINVEEESNAAKAGIQEDDLIIAVDGQSVKNTDDIVKLIKESKDKNSIMIQLNRDGKVMNIETKMPRKMRQADL